MITENKSEGKFHLTRFYKKFILKMQLFLGDTEKLETNKEEVISN